MTFKPCAVVPVYNHHSVLDAVVTALREHNLPVILVDDGSDVTTRRVLDAQGRRTGVECVILPSNQGKGVAVMTGIRHAGAQGFTHALQVDADGQHDLGDTAQLLELAADYPGHLVSGCPRYDQSVPALRFYGRYLTHALVWLETLSLTLRDSMCGFRVYPVVPALALAQCQRIGRHMDFDTDIMVRLYWAGTESIFLPTRVGYPEDGISHFRMGSDNVLMTWLHLRLIAGMFVRLPRLARRSLARRRGGRA